MAALVVSLIPESRAEALQDVQRARRAGADAVELRVDRFGSAEEVLQLVRDCPPPLIVSCRVEEDGGQFRGDPELRRELLLAAVRGGATFVDIEEWESLGLPPETRSRLIRSYHRLQEAPRELEKIAQRMARSEPDILKFVTAGYDAADLEVAQRLYRLELEQPLVAFATGRAARATRYLAALNGAPFVYCALEPGQETAPGQPLLWEAEHLYRARELNEHSSFWGLLGSPVDHSLGFQLHNGLARNLEDAPVYLPFESKQPERLIDALKHFDRRWLGLSVTAPHKTRVASLCDQLGADAEASGAVNTIVHRDGHLLGLNTDVEGVRRALGRAYDSGKLPIGKRALVFGSGGAARAAVLALAKSKANVAIAARSRRGIASFAEQQGARILPIDKALEVQQPEVIVHATPVGQEGRESLLETRDIPAHAVVLDCVYRPTETELLRRAKKAGATPISGLWMFVFQAQLQQACVIGRAESLPGVRDLLSLLGPEARALRASLRGARG